MRYHLTECIVFLARMLSFAVMGTAARAHGQEEGGDGTVPVVEGAVFFVSHLMFGIPAPAPECEGRHSEAVACVLCNVNIILVSLYELWFYVKYLSDTGIARTALVVISRW